MSTCRGNLLWRFHGVLLVFMGSTECEYCSNPLPRGNLGYSKPSSVNQLWVLSGCLDEFERTQLGLYGSLTLAEL